MATSARLDELKKKFDENPRRYFAPLANEYRKQGDLAQAIALCRTHLPNQPGHISGNIVLAQALYESRELVESRQAFEAALDLDPENLIALRYLGDIAREQGAPTVAQAWYQRVLEADPRNDEISQLLRDIESEAANVRSELAARPTPPAGAAVAEAPSAPAPALESFTAHVESFTTHVESDWQTVQDDVAPSAAAPEPEAFAPPTAPESSYDTYAASDDPFFSGATATPLGELEAVAEPTLDDWFRQVPVDADPPAASTHDALFPDLSEAAALPQPPAGDAEEPFDPSADWSAATPEPESSSSVAAGAPGFVPELAGPESELSTAAAEIEFTVEIDAPAMEAAPSNPVDFEDERAASFSLTEPPPSFDAEDDAEELASMATSSEPDPDALTLEWAAEVEAPAAACAPDEEVEEPVSAWESVLSPEQLDTGADTTMPVPSAWEVEPDPMLGRTPAFSEAIPEEAPAPFVTETMAELYLQQGFNDEALAIYRQLLAESPGDAILERRVAALEQGSASAVVDLGPSGQASQSVRAFFARFATRSRRNAAGSAASPNDSDLEDEGAPPAMGGAATREEALTQPDESPATLTEVFAARAVSPDDVQAAATLASAFGVASGGAGGELSLGHLFRDVEATAPGAVTAGEYASDPAPAAPDESQGDDVESHADIEQFTAWLEGLKKK